jgi:hypothetical protein
MAERQCPTAHEGKTLSVCDKTLMGSALDCVPARRLDRLKFMIGFR